MGPPKRVSSLDLAHDGKIPKIKQRTATSPLVEQRPQHNDFSGSVKKRLANSSRTGQACDRCKVRKIRCDGRPEGCSPCAQNRTPCKTTDRITGRATTRGQVEAMESENALLRAHVAELQAQLKELGVEPRVPPNYPGYMSTSIPWPSSTLGSENNAWTDSSQRRASTSPIPGYAPVSGVENADYRPLPQFKTRSFGDNYIGVSSTDSLLSHIKGTSLSLFGTEIDITDFVDSEEDYDKSVMSYSHFLQVALNEDHVQHIPFPPYQTLNEYANWYMRSLNPYTMVLDKPTFMQLIWRVGNEPSFSPTPAETVCVHMMLGTLKYQISMRNSHVQTTMMEESHKHYRYSLSFFKDLLKNHQWQDLQALTLICLHLRNFPKPGAAWIMCSTTFLLAVELGLHRSAKAWADAGKMDKLEVEMRKRIFWTLHAVTVNLSGKLGRPMPITIDDIDVEFPEPVNDSLPSEDTPLTPFRKCSFQVGIQIAKYTVWATELYRAIYSVRQSPRSYEDSVKRLEAGIQQWKNELPTELADPTRASPDDYIFALYLEFWDQEYQLLLHHPAVCRSTDPEIINANLDKCLVTSQKMLHNCNEVRKINCLDIPWINAVVYIAAIFTTLFIHFQRKDQMTAADMIKLRSDMSQWIEVMGACGKLLGSGDRMKNAIGKVIVHSLESIDQSIVKRTATESIARAALQNTQEPIPAPVYSNGSFAGQYSTATAETPITTNPAYASVTAGPSYSYGNGSSTPVSALSQTGHVYDPLSYSSGEDTGMTPSHAAALAAAASSVAPQRPNDNYAYANAPDAKNGQQPSYPANGTAPTDWWQWTQTYMQQVGPAGEFLNTANTLIALGGREGSAQVPGREGSVDAAAMQAPNPSNFQWPALIFGASSNGHVNQQ